MNIIGKGERGKCGQLDARCRLAQITHLGGELVKRVSLDGVDRQGVVSVDGSEPGGDWD